MRTLKKVLALTVALATLFSLTAFAAFTDEESINENYVDAVNLLGALNATKIRPTTRRFFWSWV